VSARRESDATRSLGFKVQCVGATGSAELLQGDRL
jgi:hypothetical protein